ncbi:hypothetical protein B6U74_00495 [Candidatus Bathyarchaeota archaeon ex4484_205]|nr:MAG: hypothetical protein B6U74_00495 [Candidatus Bathyarchaeota archaeon ex4484_205]RLG68921.1 MAG: hypothetical protein DRN93_01530 [archaeon]
METLEKEQNKTINWRKRGMREENMMRIKLGRCGRISKKKRAEYIARRLRDKCRRIFKKKVKISQELNKYIWSRGMEKPPTFFEVEVSEEEDYVLISLPGEKTEG